MLRLYSIVSLLILIVLLSGCHKLFQKEYSYVPPHSAADKKCIAKCMYGRKYCQRICELKNSRSCDCTTSFNTCYSACGGQVIER
ncbi:hypothetical protein AQUSIP_20600 [Aquicella siphonis]|uniref:Uncharacterized protein n=1 Tax=Aquicella siphonis TaxID=254247 RepID=A0A5E4PJJ0_9COXI|nr:hypothetical protein AQUSIP_20600 [Aquicella siphonis]